MNDTPSDMELVSGVCLHVRAFTCETAASSPHTQQMRFVAHNTAEYQSFT